MRRLILDGIRITPQSYGRHSIHSFERMPSGSALKHRCLARERLICTLWRCLLRGGATSPVGLVWCFQATPVQKLNFTRGRLGQTAPSIIPKPAFLFRGQFPVVPSSEMQIACCHFISISSFSEYKANAEQQTNQ